MLRSPLFLAVTALVVVFMLGLCPGGTLAKYKSLPDDKYCAVCERVVEIIEKKLNEVHPGATVSYGSRTDSQGFYRKVKYARSESRIIEILEEVCPAAADVNGMVKNDGGGVRYVNTNSGGSFSSLSMTGRESDEVRNACFHLVEEHEEDITGLLYDNWDDDLALRRRICVDMVDGGCTPTTKTKAEIEAELRAELARLEAEDEADDEEDNEADGGSNQHGEL